MGTEGDSVERAKVWKALQRRRELQEELNQVNTFLALYEKFVGPIGNASGTELPTPDLGQPPDALEHGYKQLRPFGPIVTPVPNVEPVRSASRTLRMNNKAFVALAREILLENGRPLGKDDLLRKIHERGLTVGGNNEAETIKSKLWRVKAEIVRIQGAGYWPVDVPCRAVSYLPPSK